MNRPRKKRCDTVAGITEIAKNLQTKIESPLPLSDQELEMFDKIIDTLPMDSWESWRIALAAQLAKMHIYSLELLDKVKEQGATVMSTTGPKANPDHTGYLQLVGKIAQLSGILGLNASNAGIEARDVRKRKETERTVKGLIEKAKSTDLLA